MNVHTDTTVTRYIETTDGDVHMGYETIVTEHADGTETTEVRWFAGDMSDDGQGVRNYHDDEAAAEADMLSMEQGWI